MTDPTASTDSSTVEVSTPEGVPLADLGLCGSLALAHWKPGPVGEPIICVLPHDVCGKMSVLELVFLLGERLCLTLEAPAADTPRGAPGPHPRINLHINPGHVYGHDMCAVVDACGVCTQDLFTPLIAAMHGTISRHLDEEEMGLLDTYGDNPEHRRAISSGDISGNTTSRPFSLVRPSQSIDAVAEVASRLR